MDKLGKLSKAFHCFHSQYESLNHYVSFEVRSARSARSVETSPFKLSESLEKLQQKLPETLVQLGASTLSTSTVAENP